MFFSLCISPTVSVQSGDFAYHITFDLHVNIAKYESRLGFYRNLDWQHVDKTKESRGISTHHFFISDLSSGTTSSHWRTMPTSRSGFTIRLTSLFLWSPVACAVCSSFDCDMSDFYKYNRKYCCKWYEAFADIWQTKTSITNFPEISTRYRALKRSSPRPTLSEKAATLLL